MFIGGRSQYLKGKNIRVRSYEQLSVLKGIALTTLNKLDKSPKSVRSLNARFSFLYHFSLFVKFFKLKKPKLN